MALDASATRLVKLLSLQARASAQALAAAIDGDEAATRQAVDAIRVLRSKLQDVPLEAHGQLELLPETERAAIQNDIDQIGRADQFLPAWCQRYAGIASYAELCKSHDGMNAHIDYLLPLAWDFEKDIVFIANEQEFDFVPVLRQRGQKRIASTICVEPDHADSDSVVITDTKEKLNNYFQNIQVPYPVRLTGIQAQGLGDQVPNVGWDEIKHAFSIFLTNHQTSQAFGDRWLTQGLTNLPHIASSNHLAALGTSLQNLPFVIIAPGPSLDKNIQLLKQLKGRAVLMAAAQCAPALSKAGIVPDFIVVIDPGDLVYFLDDVDTSAVDALLIGVSCHPSFFKKPFKSKIVFNANAGADAWISNLFEESIPLSSAGSVSIASLHIAKYLKCGPIILVGQDLALSNGKQYSSNSANCNSTPVIDTDGKTLTFSNVSANQEKIFEATGTSSRDTVEPVLTLPGYYGGIVQTRRNYHGFHGELVIIAEKEKKAAHPVPFVNCTEGGAFIDGFFHVPLSQAIEEYIPIVDQQISAKIATATNNSNNAVRRKLIRKKLFAMQNDMLEAVRTAKKCQQIILNKQTTEKNRHTLNRLEQNLIKLMKRVPAISLPNQQQIQQAMTMSDDAGTVQENFGAVSLIYDAVLRTSAQIIPLIEKGLMESSQPNLHMQHDDDHVPKLWPQYP